MFMAHATAVWTLEELHRLPDDGNRYELLDGELLVTPPPSPSHELLVSRLRSVLEPYVREHHLGDLFGPRAIVRMLGAEIEPDLMLLPPVPKLPNNWDSMPVPLLAVEVLSRTTARRDRVQKRAYYGRIGVAEYWIVDGVNRTIRVVGPDGDDRLVDAELVWPPVGASAALTIDVIDYFRLALG